MKSILSAIRTLFIVMIVVYGVIVLLVYSHDLEGDVSGWKQFTFDMEFYESLDKVAKICNGIGSCATLDTVTMLCTVHVYRMPSTIRRAVEEGCINKTLAW